LQPVAESQLASFFPFNKIDAWLCTHSPTAQGSARTFDPAKASPTNATAKHNESL
jgi:hypothetical protein